MLLKGLIYEWQILCLGNFLSHKFTLQNLLFHQWDLGGNGGNLYYYGLRCAKFRPVLCYGWILVNSSLVCKHSLSGSTVSWRHKHCWHVFHVCVACGVEVIIERTWCIEAMVPRVLLDANHSPNLIWWSYGVLLDEPVLHGHFSRPILHQHFQLTLQKVLNWFLVHNT